MKNIFFKNRFTKLLSPLFLPILVSLHSGCTDGTIDDGAMEGWEQPFSPDGTPRTVDSSNSGVDDSLRAGPGGGDQTDYSGVPPAAPPAPSAAEMGETGVITSALSLASMRTGDARYDWWDGAINNASTRYGFPDAFFIKAQIYHESNFNNLIMSREPPCGIPSGWTDGESRAYGLMQITPSCTGYFIGGNGRPNLTKDSKSPYWSTSAYHPGNNLYTGIAIMAKIMRDLKVKHPGCNATDYLRMTAAAYNAGPGHVTGCGKISSRGATYANWIGTRYRELAGLAGLPSPF